MTEAKLASAERRQSLDVEAVLNRDRDPVQRTALFALCITLPGLIECSLGKDYDKRVDPWIRPLDLLKMSLGDFNSGNLAAL